LEGELGQVYYSVLVERAITDLAFAGFLDLTLRAGRQGYARINVGYCRVDVARNKIARAFLEAPEPADDDTLIMMDADHLHPRDILERLASHEEDVVAALAFRRCPPYDPQMYRWNEAKQLVQPSSWDEGLVPVDAFGMAAFAVKRRVFQKLIDAGHEYPFFRFWYPRAAMAEQIFPSEDIYFCLTCRQAEIPLHVDTSLVCPHLCMNLVDGGTWQMYLADHPEMRMPAVNVPADMRVKVGMGE
jgi:hypothetical protein